MEKEERESEFLERLVWRIVGKKTSGFRNFLSRHFFPVIKGPFGMCV